MIQIELLLQNKGRNINVKFPCSESEYHTVCRELELKDNYAFVRDVVEPKALALKKRHVREFGRDKLPCKKNGRF